MRLIAFGLQPRAARFASALCCFALAACEGGLPGSVVTHGPGGSNGSDRFPVLLYDSQCGADCDLPGDADLRVVSVDEAPLPATGDTVLDPNFGTRIRRLSAPSQIAGGTRLRHVYAKSQPFNADNSLALLWDNTGQAWLLDTETAQLQQSVPARNSRAEYYWHPRDPNLLYVLDTVPGAGGPRALFRYRVDTDSRTLLRDFSEFTQASTRGEGNLDAAGEVLVLLGVHADGTRELIRYELGPDRVTARRTVSLAASADWVSVSPSGRYAVTLGDTTRVYDAALEPVHTFPRGTFGHADLCTRGDGRDMLLIDGADLSGADARPLFGAVLPNGPLEVFSSISWSVTPHVSCRNIDRPGWALISVMGVADTRYPVHSNEVFWLKLDGSGSVRRVASHRSDGDPDAYFSESHAVASRDATRVVFASDWHGQTGPSTFMATAPDGELPR